MRFFKWSVSITRHAARSSSRGGANKVFMDFGFSEARDQWREAVGELVRRECPPEYARRCDREGRRPVKAFPVLDGRPETIGGGSSENQRNIVAQALGL